jgi:predicted ATPase/predicted Ser/Thr protein kinase
LTEQLIFESTKSKVFLVKNDTEGIDTALKLLNSEFPGAAEVNQFYNEASVLKGISIDGVRKVISPAKIKSRHALILEWFEGQTLLEAFKNKERDIIDFLYIAIAITKTLSELHEMGIVHKDINPHNILVNLQERKIKIIDFEIASKIQTKTIHLVHPRKLQGTLAYCSPEQTGRMNRTIDFRSDLYSLGVTFYTILASHPPFESEDAMELVHSHIALRPTALQYVNPAVPTMLSEIVSVLMEKNAENRYQSAHGLNHDLEICIKQVQSGLGNNRFIIREQDYSSAFHIGQKLYGREKEIKKILSVFNESANGKSQLLLIAGYSGTGKTSLIHEAHKPITLKNGYYAEWKFDQFNKSTPYSAFLQIFSNLIDILLSESEESLNKVSSQIKNAVGSEGKVLTDLLPNLEMLIGTQPTIPSLGGEESSRRLTYLIQKFFAALCTKEHPIVFFIDDLQWIDAASIQLLKNILTFPGGSYFLCIGAYRDNEVKPGHPLLAALTSIENEGVQIETISLSNLTLDDVHHLICDSLHKEQGDLETIQLSKLVVEKTLGNAFFTVQFLKSLAEMELLKFNHRLKQWSWDVEKIRAQNITDNVVELMAEKVQKLPPNTQQVLMRMSCMGNAADLEMLSLVSELPLSDNQSHLYPALKEGLIFFINDRKLKFSHDKIQQAVYSLLDEKKRTEIHYSIGRLLQQNTPASKREEHLFDIVNHYNSALDLFLNGSPSQKLALANLNYQAALKAKLNSAFEVALDYLQRAERLFNDAPWKNQYELTFSVYKELIEVSYLCARYDLTDQYFKEINQHAVTAVDRVKAYHIKINTFKAKNDLPAAIETGLEALEILGNKLPRHPGKANVLLAIAATEFRLRNITLKTIGALPEMSDPAKIEAMRVMTNISPSAYWTEPNLIPLIANRMIRMTLDCGSNILSAWCFAGYGIILCGALGAMRKGQKYGEMGLKIHERYNTKEWKTQVEDPVYALILHWNKHVELSLLPLRNSFYTGLETGENEFACVNANIFCIHSFLCGKPLVNLNKETLAFSQTFQSLKQETQFNYNEVYRQAMLCFIGEANDPCALVGTAYNSDYMLDVHQKERIRQESFLYTS